MNPTTHSVSERPQTLFAEDWPTKALRLAQALRDATPDPWTASRQQRDRYAHLRYELQCHLEAVPA